MNEKSNIPNAALVRQYQAGREEALVELVKRWHKTFCKKAYTIVKDKDLAKDIAQDSWRTIIIKMNDLKNPDRFAPWSMRIVYTKSLDTISKIAKNRIIRKEYFEINKPEIVANESAENDSLKIELLQAIKVLPHNQQATLRLFYLENCSLKEISEIQQISVGTAKSRLFYARERLKLTLKKYKS